MVQGTLTEKDDKTVKVATGKSGKTTKVVPREGDRGRSRRRAFEAG